MLILGDNTTDADMSDEVAAFTGGSVMFLKKVPDPERFGVPIFDKKNKRKIIGIVEKPKKPSSRFASVGLYIFDNRCFEVAKKLKPSKRGQLEITDVQNFYIKEGSMKWHELKGYWYDVGTFESLLKANIYWAKKKGFKIAETAVTHYPRTKGRGTGRKLNVIIESFIDLLKLWKKLRWE